MNEALIEIEGRKVLITICADTDDATHWIHMKENGSGWKSLTPLELADRDKPGCYVTVEAYEPTSRRRRKVA